MMLQPGSRCAYGLKLLGLGLAWVWLSASSTAAWALDINTARESDLDGLKGLGPAITRRILDARAQAPFTDWTDLMQRVSGLRRPSALRLSAQGLTVNGASLPPPGELPAQQPVAPQ